MVIFPIHIKVLGEHRFYKSDTTSLDLGRLFHDSKSSRENILFDEEF